jgi:hypothetical protein
MSEDEEYPFLKLVRLLDAFESIRVGNGRSECKIWRLGYYDRENAGGLCVL